MATFKTNLKLTFIDDFSKGFSKATKEFESFTKSAESFNKSISKLSSGLNSVGTALTSSGKNLSAFVTAPIIGLGVASLKTTADLESLQMGLKAVMGNSQAASVEMVKLKEVARLPGLGFEEAVSGSVNLQSAGFSADSARRALLAFGNALATVGKGKADLDGVNLALTQMMQKEGGFAQEINQLGQRLPQLRGALKSAFGTANTEEISKMATGPEVIARLIVEFEKLDKVNGGLRNSFENLGDSVKVALGHPEKGLGAQINRIFNVSGKLDKLGSFIENLSDKFDKLSDEQKKNILITAGVIASIGPVLIGFGSMLSSIGFLAQGIIFVKPLLASLGVLFGSLSFPVILIGAAIAGLALFIARGMQKSEAFRDAIFRLGSIMWKLIEPLISLMKVFGRLLGILDPSVSAFDSIANFINKTAAAVELLLVPLGILSDVLDSISQKGLSNTFTSSTMGGIFGNAASEQNRLIGEITGKSSTPNENFKNINNNPVNVKNEIRVDRNNEVSTKTSVGGKVIHSQVGNMVPAFGG